MSLKITCGKPDCGMPAEIVLVGEEYGILDEDEGTELLLTAYGVCGDHAAEEVVNARAMMAPDDYAVLNAHPLNGGAA